MNITIFGATGQVGKRLVQMALAKNYFVSAFGRDIAKWIDADISNPNFKVIKGYVFNKDEVKQALYGCNAVASCLGGAFDGLDKTRSIGIKNIINQMQLLNIKRIVAVGGLGALNKEDNELIINSPDYPEQYKPVGEEHVKALEYLQASNLDWTFICPPNILDEDYTGQYDISSTYPPLNNKGEITAGDIAHCMLQAIEQNDFFKQKLGITKL